MRCSTHSLLRAAALLAALLSFCWGGATAAQVRGVSARFVASEPFLLPAAPSRATSLAPRHRANGGISADDLLGDSDDDSTVKRLLCLRCDWSVDERLLAVASPKRRLPVPGTLGNAARISHVYLLTARLRL